MANQVSGNSGTSEAVGELGNPHRAENVNEEQLLRALMFAVFSTGVHNTSGAIIGSLATLAKDPEDWAAYRLAVTAIVALVSKNARARADVMRCDAARFGRDLTQSAISILELAATVDATAEIYRYKNPQGILPSKDAILREFSDYLRTLIADDPDRLPTLQDLEGWISAHSEKGARGKHTTTGIVARIMQRGRLFGAPCEDFGKTLSRVDAVLSRARKMEQRLRQDVHLVKQAG